MNRLVAILGPTGIGKSRLALQLAQTFQGEIVSADSRQVYRYMDIGTAKPTREERVQVPYHIIDIVNPDEDFSLAQYKQLAYQAINDVQSRGKLPLLVGGSGLYVWAVLEGWEIPEIAPSTEFRRSLEERVAAGGLPELLKELAVVDPVAAQKIDPRNVRRVIRALEVHKTTGAPISRLQKKGPPPYETLIIGLTADRAELYRRVDSRVDWMIEQGLVDEVKKLLEMGYSLSLPAMSGIGYKQIVMYLNGEMTLAEVIQKIKVETHRFVRHQYNWFRLKDKRIMWLDIEKQPEKEIAVLMERFMAG